MTITPIITYVMKATINSPPYTKVTWKVYNAADMTGAQSGYDPSTLIDIVVDYTIINKAAVEQATPVVFQPGGLAGGDLGGTYPDPDVLKIHGYAVASTAPANQQVLIWNSTTQQYEPGAQLSGPPSGVAGGDLGGTYPNPIVSGIDNSALTNHNAAGDILTSVSTSNITWAKLTNSNVDPAAAISYTKLLLTGAIVNADINASAAIAGSKINPNFGSQALTAGQVTLGSTSSVNSLLGSLAFESRTISTSDTIDVFQKDLIIYVDTSSAAVSLTLPTPTAGRFIIVKDKKQTFATNNLTLVRSGSEKIDGVAASLVLDVNNKELIIISDGTDWYTNNTSATPTGAAGGDLTGTYPNPQIAAGVIVNADVNASAAIAYSKLNLSGSIVNADVNASAAIAYSKLNLSNSIVDADVNSAAAIAGTKISPDFGSQTVQTTGSLFAGATTLGTLSATTSTLGSSTSANSISGSLTFTTKTFSTTGTIDTTTKDLIVYADTTGGAFTLTLPAPTNGRTLIIKDKKQNFATANLTLARNGSEKIDGTAASLVLSVNNQEIIITSDGTDWYTQGGSSIVWATDLAGSTDTSQIVVGLTGSASTVAVHAQNLLWDSGIPPTLSQTSTIGAGSTFYILAQDSTNNVGGDLRFEAGDGNNPNAGGQVFITGGTCNGGGYAGANILLSGGTSSAPGTVSINSGGSELAFNNAGALTFNRFTTNGVLHTISGNGTFSVSNVVNADIDSAAAIAVSKLAAGTAGQLLLNDSGPTPTWTTMSGDATISSSGVLSVTDLTGAAGTVDIASTGNILTWAAATTAPGITQTSTSSGSGATMTIAAQPATGASNNGGGLVLAGGTSGSATAGTVVLKTANTTRLTAGATGVITIANLSTGVVHADSSGNLTSSTIVNADVNASAAIDVSKLAAGTAAQILLNNSTPTPTWTSVTGDISITNAGVTSLDKIKTRTIHDTTPNDGDVIVWDNSNNYWKYGAGGGGGSVTWGSDLVNSTSTNQYVSALSYSSSAAGGTIAINGTGTTLVWDKNVTAPSITQAAQSSTSSTSGANAVDSTIKAQAGQAATGASHNGGNGGNLVLGAGLGGTSGSATAGLDGYVKFTSGEVYPTATKTSAYTLTYSDHHIFANPSSGFNLTLPSPINGLTFEIWDISGTAETNNVTLVRNGSEKISGVAASRVLSTNWGHWTITSNGTDWFLG